MEKVQFLNSNLLSCQKMTLLHIWEVKGLETYLHGNWNKLRTFYWQLKPNSFLSLQSNQFQVLNVQKLQVTLRKNQWQVCFRNKEIGNHNQSSVIILIRQLMCHYMIMLNTSIDSHR